MFQYLLLEKKTSGGILASWDMTAPFVQKTSLLNVILIYEYTKTGTCEPTHNSNRKVFTYLECLVTLSTTPLPSPPPFFFFFGQQKPQIMMIQNQTQTLKEKSFLNGLSKFHALSLTFYCLPGNFLMTLNFV